MWTDRMIERRMAEDGYDDEAITDFIAERNEQRRAQAKEDAYDEMIRRTKEKERKDAEQAALYKRTSFDPFMKAALR